MNKVILLSLIFFIALLIRFLFFPDNIYFGYDQARDAFNSLEIFKGDLKIIGPTTSFPGLHHGVLYYYILAPLYGLFNVETAALILRIFNSLGIFLIFYTAKTIFNNRVGLIAAFLYALSFEQTQFSIYMGNPSLAVLSMSLMYLGMALVIFKKKSFGLPLAMLGFGSSIQFQFVLAYLVIPLMIILILFRKSLKNLKIKTWLISTGALLVSLSSFLLAEIKYNFPTFHGILELSHAGSNKNIFNIFQTYFFTIKKMVAYNLTDSLPVIEAVVIFLLILLIWSLRKKEFRGEIIFLVIWFFGIVPTFIVNGGVADLDRNVPLYYPNVGVSLNLLIFVSFLLARLKNQALVVLIVFIALANLNSILSFNPKGTISEIDVQQGMILADEKKVLDSIYQDAKGEPFAVKAVTMPLFVNTTWSYLFSWYGQGKYGYLPIWNGKNAEGYPGNLKVIEAQENLPGKRYLIIEPVRGIAPYLIDDYLKEEGYFTKVVWERKIGLFTIQNRRKI